MIVSGLYFNQPMILTIEHNDSRHLHNGRHDEKSDLHYINFEKRFSQSLNKLCFTLYEISFKHRIKLMKTSQ
jgi:hypothetical protein